MVKGISEIDMKILKLLSKDARLTYKELAEILGTTRQRVSRRMDRLEKSGIVKKYTVIPDYEALGYSHVVLGITLRPSVDIDEVVENLRQIDEVKIIERGLGAHNLIVHVIGPKDMKELEKIISLISKKMPGLEKMDITFVTDVVKFETL